MKTKPIPCVVVALILCFMLGSIPFRTILVCVHGEDFHGKQAVHLHYDQLPGQPCEDSSEGFNHGESGEGRRHFSLRLETINRSQPTFKRVLSLRLPIQFRNMAAASVSPGIFQEGPSFGQTSSGFLDTSFTTTTILII